MGSHLGATPSYTWVYKEVACNQSFRILLRSLEFAMFKLSLDHIKESLSSLEFVYNAFSRLLLVFARLSSANSPWVLWLKRVVSLKEQHGRERLCKDVSYSVFLDATPSDCYDRCLMFLGCRHDEISFVNQSCPHCEPMSMASPYLGLLVRGPQWLALRESWK